MRQPNLRRRLCDDVSFTFVLEKMTGVRFNYRVTLLSREDEGGDKAGGGGDAVTTHEAKPMRISRSSSTAPLNAKYVCVCVCARVCVLFTDHLQLSM